MEAERPRDVAERQREHHRHAAILQRPHPQEDEQEYTDERAMEYMNIRSYREQEDESNRDHGQEQQEDDESPGIAIGT